MRIFIVYAHPSEDSFTRHIRESFINGLEDAGHTYILSDLYQMGYTSEMSEAEYYREAHYRDDLPLAADVLTEQSKINAGDAIVFIYPVFWTEAPAKLVGWFDRVWTYGFAYGDRSMKQLEKGLVICITGHSLENLKAYGHWDAMRTVMLGDRLFDRVKTKDMIAMDSMTQYNPDIRAQNWDKHIKTAYDAGFTF